MHANQLNADSMPDLLAMIKRRGYKFVSLTARGRAIRRIECRRPMSEKAASRGIHRWSMTKGMPPKASRMNRSGSASVSGCGAAASGHSQAVARSRQDTDGAAILRRLSISPSTISGVRAASIRCRWLR